MSPGDIAFVWYPFKHDAEEPFKRRPVLLVGGTMPGEPGDQAILVAQVTGDPRRVEAPGQGDVVIPAWREAGLKKPSVVRARRLWTAQPSDLDRVLGRLPLDVFAEVLTHVRLMVASIGA